MVLGILGASGFFSWAYYTLQGYASYSLFIGIVICVLFVLLLASLVITFVSRREIADTKNTLEETKQSLQKELNYVDQLQKARDDLVKKYQNDELEKLIKPLYLSLDSNRDNPIKGAHLAFEDIKRYGNLAQPELRKLLHQYCDIREENPTPEDRAPSYQWSHQSRLSDTIDQINALVKARYNDLMWEGSEVIRTAEGSITETERESNKDELEKLIKPLYFAFDKCPTRNGLSSSLIHQLSTPPEQWNNAAYKTSGLKELVEESNLVIEIMRQNRELAQSGLQELIDGYLNLRKNRKENDQIKYYSKAEKILNEISNNIKTRYHELTDVK
jgi:hypothetical protein